MKPEIPEFISISAAGIWAHLMLLRLALEYYNVSRQYDTIINRIDAPMFLAAFLCVVAFALHVLARISSRRWGWGLVVNLLLVPLSARFVYDRALNVLAENAIRWSQQVTREPIVAPSPEPTLVFRQVSTDQWMTYTDPVSHFSIQYPPGWEPQPPKDHPFPGTGREIEFIRRSENDNAEDPPIVFITVFDNPDKLALSQWVETKIVKRLPIDIQESLQRGPIVVGDLAGEQIIGLPSRTGTIVVYIASGVQVYEFALGPYEPDTPALAEASHLAAEVFYQMLGTVVFETK